MSPVRKRGGFTLLEMLVASLLLSMMVVALSMVFSSSASAWRIGRAGVDGLHEMRHTFSYCQIAADNALPNLRGEGTGVGYVRAVWLNGDSFVDAGGASVSVKRGFDTRSDGRAGVDTSGRRPYVKNISGGSVNGNGFKNYIVGAGSAGPDHKWDTKDDIVTWPNETGGGL